MLNMNFFTKAKDSIFLVLKGAAVGIGNAIPGVSGGTIAVVTYHAEYQKADKKFAVSYSSWNRNGDRNFSDSSGSRLSF